MHITRKQRSWANELAKDLIGATTAPKVLYFRKGNIMSYDFVICKDYDMRKKDCAGIWKENEEHYEPTDICLHCPAFNRELVS